MLHLKAARATLTEDPHDSLCRAFLPSPGNEAEMRQFHAEIDRLAERKKRQIAKRARRDAGDKRMMDPARLPPIDSTDKIQDIDVRSSQCAK